MNIHEDAKHPWLLEEKAYLDRVIAAKRPVLGVCLGAQLLADRLGAEVTRNTHQEIGWSRLRTNAALREPGEILSGFPEVATVFQWHGDTFSLPQGAATVGSTEACLNQGFLLGSVLALQFHLELSPGHLSALIDAQDVFEGPYVQSPSEFLLHRDDFRQNREWLANILDRIHAGALRF
jgi:GMP synthase-like glutamine amidotransferase